MTYLPSSFGTRYGSVPYTVKLQNPVDLIESLPKKVKRKEQVAFKLNLSDLLMMKRFSDCFRPRWP